MKHLFTRIHTLLFSALLLSHTLHADVISFSTDSQSMWQTGTAGMLNESIFVGTTWDTPKATLGGIAGGVVSTPKIERKLITPAIPRKRITKAVPRKLLVKSKKICIPFGGCFRTKAIYSPAIPAVYTPAIPAVYTPEIPSFSVDTSTGAKVDVATQGKVGFQFSVQADAGSVNANVEFDASLTAPEEVNAFELFELNADSTLLDNSTFDTNFPQISTKAEFILGANIDIDGQVCAVGNCEQGSTNIGFEEFALELVSFNQDNNGKVRLLGLDELEPSAFNFGSPISVTAGPTEVGNVTISVPNLQTNGLTENGSISATGSADFLDLKLDIDGILTASAGLPPVLGASVDAGIFSAGYDIIDVEFGPVLEVKQTFELVPELMVDLSFSESILVEGLSERVKSITAAVSDIPKIALGMEQSVDVTSNYWVDAKVHNTTQLGIDGEFTLDVLKASFSLEALGASYDLGELGPLFNFTERFDIADLPPLFEQEFALGGFNQVAGESFNLSTVSAPTGGTDEAPAEVELANSVAVLTTGSPVELSQQVNKPITDTFTFSFDYLFNQANSILKVYLGGLMLTSIMSDSAMLDFATFSQVFNTSDYFSSLDVLDLTFVFDSISGEAGHTLLIDNVVFPDLLNGNFDLASVTGSLTDWQSSTSSPNGFVGSARLESEDVSAPYALSLALIAMLFMAVRRMKLTTLFQVNPFHGKVA